ncbi:MAG TPA: shikimate kinase [Rhodanobacteraceae bacterium]|nr:shikimate kinase [Rhodanobacteraceae bacterium]
MNPSPNLFFVGPMGSGKTTVGRRVAELLGLPFHDLDHEIETRTGASVNLVFDVEGEPGFRTREAAVLAEFAAGTGVVLATGGGAVLQDVNRAVLRTHGFVVWLDADPDAQLARLTRDRRRPLLAGPDRHDRLRQFAMERNSLYAEIADLRVPSSGVGNSAQQAQRVVGLLENHWRRSHAHAFA